MTQPTFAHHMLLGCMYGSIHYVTDACFGHAQLFPVKHFGPAKPLLFPNDDLAPMARRAVNMLSGATHSACCTMMLAKTPLSARTLAFTY